MKQFYGKCFLKFAVQSESDSDDHVQYKPSVYPTWTSSELALLALSWWRMGA